MSDKDSYGEIWRVLSNIRSIRVFARETDFELLEEMHEKLGAAIEECRADAEKETAAGAERAEKQTCSKTSKAPAKYEFVENGETKTWTGKGRKPKPIAEALSAGRSLEEFLINKGKIQ